MASPLSRLSPELQLILAACRLSIVKDEQKRQRAYADCQHLVALPNFNWQNFLEHNTRHKVYGLIYEGLYQAEVLKKIPDEVSLAIQNQAQVNVQNALAQTLELVRLHKLFDQTEIFMLPLKGVVLSQRLFGQLTRRSAGDLDILVQPGSLDCARQILLVAGYTLILPNFPLTLRQQEMFLQVRHHYAYLHPKSLNYLELHWKLLSEETPFDAQSMHQMLARCVFISIGDRNLPCFADPDLLLYLSLHGSRHRWFRLKWLCDLAVLLQDLQQIDEPFWKTLTQQRELELAVREGLTLAHLLLDTPSPYKPSNSIAVDTTLTQQESLIYEEYLRYLSMSPETWRTKEVFNAARRGRILSRFAVNPNLKHKWAVFWRLWVEPEDWRDFPLPDWLFPLYFVLRPFFWVWRYYIPLPPNPPL